jgi:iron(III) transport system ATP-binding protein
VSDRIIVMSQFPQSRRKARRASCMTEPGLDAFVADFIGDANMVDVTVKSVADGRAAVAIGPANVSLAARGLQPGPAKAAIRPQSLLVSRHESQGTLPGSVRKCAYLGNHLDLMIETAVGELFVISHDVDDMLLPGTPVWLSFASSGVILVP